MVSPLQKRRAVQGVVQAGLCSQRRACRYLGVHRSSHRHTPKQPSEWLLRLHQQIEKLSSKYPRLMGPETANVPWGLAYRDNRASMAPGPDGPGDGIELPLARARCRLLQWGRVLMGPETSNSKQDFIVPGTRFNGAGS